MATRSRTALLSLLLLGVSTGAFVGCQTAPDSPGVLRLSATYFEHSQAHALSGFRGCFDFSFCKRTGPWLAVFAQAEHD